MNAEDSYFIGGEVRLPDWLMSMELSTGAKLTYNVLATCAGGRDHAWPKQEYLARRVSASVRTIQRYLGELARHGLIAVSRESLKGKMRCVYAFLSPGAGPGRANLSPPPGGQDEKKPAGSPICRLERDNLSPSLNKEETIKGKKEEDPPAPQEARPASGLEAGTGDPGQGGGDFSDSEEPEREPQPERPEASVEASADDPAWARIKARLRAELSDSFVETWLEPLQFEQRNGQAILKAPNKFFQTWVRRNYGEELGQAFQGAGLTAVSFEEMTPEEGKKHQRRLDEAARRNQKRPRLRRRRPRRGK